MNFAAADCLPALLQYLKKNTTCVITEEVDRELCRLSSLRDDEDDELIHPNLAFWPMLSDRPKRVEVGTGFVQEMADMQNALRQPGDHPRANLGEASTIAKAMEFGSDVAIAGLDDRGAKGLARPRNIGTVSTTQLVCQMVVAKAITKAEGLAVYTKATPDELSDGTPFPTQRYYDDELRRQFSAMKAAAAIRLGTARQRRDRARVLTPIERCLHAGNLGCRGDNASHSRCRCPPSSTTCADTRRAGRSHRRARRTAATAPRS